VERLWIARYELDVFLPDRPGDGDRLAAKNAILIVEFSKRNTSAGPRFVDAALAGARVRLRPILMTRVRVHPRVLPLVVSTGARQLTRSSARRSSVHAGGRR